MTILRPRILVLASRGGNVKAATRPCYQGSKKARERDDLPAKVVRQMRSRRPTRYPKEDSGAWFAHVFQVRMSLRFSRRALLLAGRLPWLAFFNLR